MPSGRACRDAGREHEGMEKYEYMFVTQDEALNGKLVTLGAEGWRLVPASTLGGRLVMERIKRAGDEATVQTV